MPDIVLIGSDHPQPVGLSALMIISYRHNFIYVRTRKTASSTIEEVLRANLGRRDVFVENNRLVCGKNCIPSEVQPEEVGQHLRLTDIKPLVPRGFWKRCFKFSSDRHPYEKAVSLAYYNLARFIARSREPVEFPQRAIDGYLDIIVRTGNYPSYDHFTVNGELAIDDFIRFETLADDLHRIARKLGLSVPAELPFAKGSHRVDRRPAMEVLSEEQKDIVFRRCEKEFVLFGYER